MTQLGKCDICGERHEVLIAMLAYGETLNVCQECNQKMEIDEFENLHERWAADAEYGFYPEPVLHLSKESIS